jgi:hypothetical protein
MALVQLTSEMSAGDLFVGVGTMLLAAVTAWLAARTSREVALTKEGLALNRESIEALDRPFIVATPNDIHGLVGFIEPGPEHPGFRFAYRLWNIGKGPAIVNDVSLIDLSTQHEYLTDVERIERAVAVAPSGRDELSSLADGAPPGVGAHLALRISYRSASGMSYMTHSSIEVVEGLRCICRDFRRAPA